MRNLKLYVLSWMLMLAGCKVVESDGLSHNERWRNLVEQYRFCMSEEDNWMNGYVYYSKEAVPIEGIEENREFLYSYWSFPYSRGNGRWQWERYIRDTGIENNVDRQRKLMRELVREYGLGSFTVEMCDPLLSVSEAKSLVWLDAMRGSEYFLWRHHALVEPTMKNARLGGWAEREQDQLKSKIIAECKRLQRLESGPEGWVDLNDFKARVLFAAWLRRFSSEETIHDERKRFLAMLKTKGVFPELWNVRFADHLRR